MSPPRHIPQGPASAAGAPARKYPGFAPELTRAHPALERARIGKAFAKVAGAAMSAPHDTDVFTLAEIAAAAGVSDRVVLDLAARGCLPTLVEVPGAPLAAVVSNAEAVAAVQALASGATVGVGSRSALAIAPEPSRPTGLPVLVSTGLHVLSHRACAER